MTTRLQLQPSGVKAPGMREIHDLWDGLRRLLALPQPPILTLRLRLRFLEAIAAMDESVWIAFGLSVIVPLARTIDSGCLRGSSPSELRTLTNVLLWARSMRTPPYCDDATWHQAVDRAIDTIAAHEGWLAVLLDGSSQPTDLASTGGPTVSYDGTQASDRGVDIEGAGSSILIPVIARMSVPPTHVHHAYRGVEAAQMLNMHVHAQIAPGTRRVPQLVTDGKLNDQDIAAFRLLLPTCAALRPTGCPPLRQCLFTASWDAGSSATVLGRSSSLAFVLASTSAWARLSASPVQAGLLSGVAASGALGQAGQLGPVATETLALKVRAAFYSAAQVLVVPAEQAESALLEVRRLNLEHPKRQLLVRGHSDVHGAWTDPRVVTPRIRPVRLIARNLVLRLVLSRAFIVLVALTMLAVAGLVARESVLSERRPVDLRREDGAIVALNRHGRVCLRIAVLPGKIYEVGPGRTEFGRTATVIDVEGDDRNEVAAIHFSQAGTTDLLSVFDRNGTLLWRRRAGAPVTAQQDSLFGMHWICLGTVEDPTGGSDVLALRRSTESSLSLLERFDGRTGDREGVLRNSGHLEYLQRFDLDGDGAADWLALGRDARSGGGVLGVLDPASMRLPMEGGWDEMPGLTDPQQVGRGVRMAIVFPRDRFVKAGAISCENVSRDIGGGLLVATQAGPSRHVLYHLTVDRVEPVCVAGVQFGQNYIAVLMAETPEGIDRLLAAESDRLTSQVRVLSDQGWCYLPECDSAAIVTDGAAR